MKRGGLLKPKFGDYHPICKHYAFCEDKFGSRKE